jgi:hypothetical protein
MKARNGHFIALIIKKNSKYSSLQIDIKKKDSTLNQATLLIHHYI